MGKLVEEIIEFSLNNSLTRIRYDLFHSIQFALDY